MSWEVRTSSNGKKRNSPYNTQIHYNQPEVADLHTYLEDASIFAVKDGHVDILQGKMAVSITPR